MVRTPEVEKVEDIMRDYNTLLKLWIPQYKQNQDIN